MLHKTQAASRAAEELCRLHGMQLHRETREILRLAAHANCHVSQPKKRRTSSRMFGCRASCTNPDEDPDLTCYSCANCIQYEDQLAENGAM